MEHPTLSSSTATPTRRAAELTSVGSTSTEATDNTWDFPPARVGHINGYKSVFGGRLAANVQSAEDKLQFAFMVAQEYANPIALFCVQDFCLYFGEFGCPPPADPREERRFVPPTPFSAWGITALVGQINILLQGVNDHPENRAFWIEITVLDRAVFPHAMENLPTIDEEALETLVPPYLMTCPARPPVAGSRVSMWDVDITYGGDETIETVRCWDSMSLLYLVESHVRRLRRVRPRDSERVRFDVVVSSA